MASTILIRRFYRELHNRGLRSQKENIVYGLSGDRTFSASQLTDEEILSFINQPKSSDEVDCDRLRKRLIAMSYSIGESVDFVAQWTEKYGIRNTKKKFNDYNKTELIGLVAKFKNVINHRIN